MTEVSFPVLVTQANAKRKETSASREDLVKTQIPIKYQQKPIRVETCNGPLCAGKQASEYSICKVPYLEQQEQGVSKYGT